jgi:hypothetical protein
MPMKITDLQLLKNSRLVTGLSLFIIALLAASLIAKEANRTVYVWASSTELAPGNVITQSDIKATPVLLPESAKNYLSASAQIIGAVVKFRVAAGDLIPLAAITSTAEQLDLRAVPLTVESTDLPMGLTRGEVIDIYAIPTSNSISNPTSNPTSNPRSIVESTLLTERVSVSEVSERNNSGKASVVVSLPQPLITLILNHLADSRLIIVRGSY